MKPPRSIAMINPIGDYGIGGTFVSYPKGWPPMACALTYPPSWG
jgi:hypothetical protein